MLSSVFARFRKPTPLVPLAEALRRRPDFSPPSRCVGVELANGETWFIPKPMVELRPDVDATGLSGFGVPLYGDGAGKCFGPEYLELVAEMNTIVDPLARVGVTLKIAGHLLRQNYTLDHQDIRTLLPLVFGDEDNDRMWNDIGGVIVGNSPKAQPPGG